MFECPIFEQTNGFWENIFGEQNGVSKRLILDVMKVLRPLKNNNTLRKLFGDLMIAKPFETLDILEILEVYIQKTLKNNRVS